MMDEKKPGATFSRRQALGAVVAGGLATGTASCVSTVQSLSQITQRSKDAGDSQSGTTKSSRLASAPPLPSALLVNRERAAQFMRAEKVDAIVCVCPENIYYLTNYYPQLAKMGMANLTYAILPLDINAAPILVIGQFEYYVAAAQSVTGDNVDVRFFTMPADAEAFARESDLAAKLDADGSAGFLPTKHSFHPPNPIESLKRENALHLSGELGATSQTSFLKALRDMPHPFKRVAIDDADLAEQIKQADIDVSFSNGEQLLRRIRLQKSDAEISLMRYAANANAQAGLAAAKMARSGATFQDIRREYSRQCADRFMTPEFMVIDGVIPDSAPGEIEDGRAFLIDCVSHGQYYHGDYGRTVCVGEPTGEIKRATDAIARVWDDLLPQLKPGLRYSEIGEIATKVFSNTNSVATLICNPHSVGIHHSDDPSVPGSAFYTKDDVVLVENMVISVDLPVVDVGLGGSAHLEDLVLIGKDGATLLNDAGDRVIIV